MAGPARIDEVRQMGYVDIGVRYVIGTEFVAAFRWLTRTLCSLRQKIQRREHRWEQICLGLRVRCSCGGVEIGVGVVLGACRRCAENHRCCSGEAFVQAGGGQVCRGRDAFTRGIRLQVYIRGLGLLRLELGVGTWHVLHSCWVILGRQPAMCFGC